MIKIGIIGGAGYTAGELIRLLVNHPQAQIAWVHSESNAGNPLASVHAGLLGETDMKFTDNADLSSVDVLFMCGAHGRSAEFWASRAAGAATTGLAIPAGLKVIDLAQDFRDESEGFIYGLPEWQRARIAAAGRVANPGCFATAIQLALLPLAGAGLLNSEVNVTAITGSTGAGVKPSATTHFSWRTDNLSAYKVFEHQHLLEIRRNLAALAAGTTAAAYAAAAEPQINFVPVRGDFARGIFATVYTDCPLSEEDAAALYKNKYSDAAFTFVSDAPVDLKQVVNTNKCILHVEKHGSKLVITSVIDNLLKGASGQAVQNMNLMCGLDEKAGLHLKASAF
ncbi:MAG: N-acetyl-gamma-glutamyl-phosphate reductase [Bacteroidales bacterium]|nr:N-acetyl-gamma-glutamyl-phosphate reductase [Bacteroidales bacterium]